MPDAKNSPVPPEQLVALAKKVSRWAKAEASRQQDMANFEVDARDLTGMCAIAAAKAHALLTQSGITGAKIALSFHWTEGHAFVVVDGYCVDPTAMQFGLDKPLVFQLANRKNPWYYAKPKFFDNSDEFAKHLDHVKWSAKQHPRCVHNTLTDAECPPQLHGCGHACALVGLNGFNHAQAIPRKQLEAPAIWSHGFGN